MINDRALERPVTEIIQGCSDERFYNWIEAYIWAVLRK